MSMKKLLLLFFSVGIIFLTASSQKTKNAQLNFYPAGNVNIQYTGRIAFSKAKLSSTPPRFWQPGVYFTARFKGTRCEVILNDQVLWGKNHNYLEVVVDGKAKRLQTKAAHDTIVVVDGLSAGVHSLLVCKNTEANIGYLELVGIRCKQLLKPLPKPTRKIEFIGNSITCGAGADQSSVPCGKGMWQDQHNAYLSYGPTVAREVNAQWVLSSVSGIGLIHSCCNLEIKMPQVFDKIEMRGDSLAWNFADYQPDVVTVCLGQNDGVQDSTAFCRAYVAFVKRLRNYYPSAQIVLLTSPMADGTLTVALKKYLTAVKTEINKTDRNVDTYFFSKRYHNGCDSHPDLAEHQQIAKELGIFIRKKMKW
jgi:lysophospholipase L1-like esterase